MGFGLLFLAAALILPSIIDAQLQGFIEDRVGRKPTIERISINPFRLRLTIEGFEIQDSQGSEAVLAFDGLAIDLRLLGFLSADLGIDEIVLEAPRVLVERSEAGELNLLSWLANAQSRDDGSDAAPLGSDDSESGWIVEFSSIRIEAGELLFRDLGRSPAFEAQVAPLDLVLSDVSTRAGVAAPFSLGLRFADSAKLDWRGTFGVNPVRADGQIELHDFDLRVAWTYLSEVLKFEIKDGALDFAANIDVGFDEGLSISISDAGAELKDFELVDRMDGSAVFTMPKTAVRGIDLQANALGLESMRIASVLVDGGQVRTHRGPDGAFHLVELFRPISTNADVGESSSSSISPAEAEFASTGGEEGVQPSVRVDRIELRDFGIDFEDRVPLPPVPIELSAIRLAITGFESTPGGTFDLIFESNLNGTGRFEVAGELGADPLVADLSMSGSEVPLVDLQSYAKSFAAIELTQGTLTTALDLSIANPVEASANPVVSLAGRIQIDDLRLLDRRDSQRLIAWKALKLEGLALSGDKLKIEEVLLSDASLDLIRDVDGRLNLDSILISDSDGSKLPRNPEATRNESSSSEDEALAPGMAIEIDKVQVTGFGFAFRDLSVEPAFALNVDAVQGEIKGLSSDETVRADVEFEGLIDEVAPIRLFGSINPFAVHTFTDLTATVSGVSMPALDPYAAKFAGYTIDRGRLDLDLVYRLEAGELEAENHFALRKFAFGESVESEEATALPVSLAVALMRDGAGDINLDLPIRGRVDDPDFSVLGLIAKTFVSLIGKIATSPFSLLSGAISQSPDGFARVVFEPGSDRLTPSEGQELTVLAEAISQRPGLRLEIRGRADPEVDGPALRTSKIEHDIRLAVFNALPADEQERLGDAQAVVVDAGRRLGELEKLYVARTGGRPTGLLPAQPSEANATRTRRLTEAVLDSLASQVELVESDWRTLAKSRAMSVQSVLIRDATIEPGRIDLVDVEIGSVSSGGQVSTELTLAVE